MVPISGHTCLIISTQFNIHQRGFPKLNRSVDGPAGSGSPRYEDVGVRHTAVKGLRPEVVVNRGNSRPLVKNFARMTKNRSQVEHCVIANVRGYSVPEQIHEQDEEVTTCVRLLRPRSQTSAYRFLSTGKIPGRLSRNRKNDQQTGFVNLGKTASPSSIFLKQ